MDSSINSMAINYSQNDDVVVPNNSHVYRGLEGDDIYILTSQITSEKKISIVDTKGLNKIQIVDNLKPCEISAFFLYICNILSHNFICSFDIFRYLRGFVDFTY